MKLLWSEESLLDIQDIHDYIARDSKYYASSQIKQILSHEDQIKEYPQSGRVVPEYENESIREVLEGNYRIIYHIASESLITVLTVVHSARDLSNL